VTGSGAVILSISGRVGQDLRPQDPPGAPGTYSLHYRNFN
jgi:hypothetical protein